jgi:hypothetical protein
MSNNHEDEDDGLGIFDFQCFPSKLKKARTKEGKRFRMQAGCFLIMNIGFLVISFWQKLSVFQIMREFMACYFCYFIYMTLSRIGSIIFCLFTIVGSFYSIFEILSFPTTTTVLSMLIYSAMVFMQFYFVTAIFQSLVKYSESLDKLEER